MRGVQRGDCAASPAWETVSHCPEVCVWACLDAGHPLSSSQPLPGWTAKSLRVVTPCLSPRCDCLPFPRRHSPAAPFGFPLAAASAPGPLPRPICLLHSPRSFPEFHPPWGTEFSSVIFIPLAIFLILNITTLRIFPLFS